MAEAKHSSLQSAPRSESPSIRSFREMPARGTPFVQAFLSHVKTTGQPETFPGLHPGPLAKNEPFRKIAPFEIDRRRRPEHDRAPCPMCHHRNKFLKGWFVYLPNRQAITAIGCECADNEMLVAANRDYKARRDRELEEDYLLANLPLVPAQLAVIVAIRPTALEALRVYRLFRRNGAPFHRQLRRVKQRGGQLILSEEITGELAATGPRGYRGTSGVSTRDIQFGMLGGTTALIGDYSPVKELDQITAALNHQNRGETEDAALEYIVTLNDAARRRAYVELTEAARSYSKFRNRLIDFVEFFEPDNIARVKTWASHPTHPQPFEVSLMERSRMTILVMRRGNERFQVVLDADLRKPVPNWPK